MAILTFLLLLFAQPAATEPVAQQFGWSTARFYESESAREAAQPSAILPREPRYPQPLRADFPVIPRYDSTPEQRRVTIDLPPNASVYGLGAAPGGLLRNGFSAELSGLHASIVVVRENGTAFAAFADTSYPITLEITDQISIQTRGPSLPIIIAGGESIGEVMSNIANLTGHFEMPPRWALGLALEVPTPAAAEAALARAIKPAAIFVPVSEDHAKLFALTEAAAEQRVRIAASMTECGPQPLAEPIEEIADSFLALEKRTGCPVPDLTSEHGRGWWTSQSGRLRAGGLSGALVRWSEHPIHAERFKGDNWWGVAGGDRYASLLPRLAVESTRSGIAPDETGIRPWVIGTQWVIGAQRGGGTVVPAGPGALAQILKLSMSGAPFVGVRGESVEQLATALACLPIAIGVADDEGRLEGDQELLARLLRIRTRLQPYIYTQTFSAFYEGQPVIRPVFFADPQQSKLRGIDHAFLLGPDLLVIPPAADGSRSPPPLKNWRKLDLGEEGALIPEFYLRPGAILPTAAPEQHHDEYLNPLILLANLDHAGEAQDVLYEDSGDTYEFYRNMCRRIGHRAHIRDDAVLVQLSRLDGGWGFPDRKLIVHVLTDDGTFTGEGTERGTLRIPLTRPAPDHDLPR